MSMWKDFSDTISIGHEDYGIGSVLHMYNLLNKAQSNEGASYKHTCSGRGKQDVIMSKFTKIFGPPISIIDHREHEEFVFTDECSYVDVVFNKTKKSGPVRVEVTFVTTSNSLFDLIKKETSSLIQEKPASNSIFALTSSRGGLTLTDIGTIDQKISKHNYSSKTMEGYLHVRGCLSSKDPCGRLILFQGLPGTGKSYMIRSLVSSIDSTFVIVGSNMIADLSGPSILPVLLGSVEANDKPITFILEDADVALTDRKQAGMSQLSCLLNLGDGLLGEMLDIRIIATTNARTLDLDSAIVRPGRMCQHVSFGLLSIEEANTLYSKLVKDSKLNIKKPITLAEVYRRARQDGWEAPKSDEKQGTYL